MTLRCALLSVGLAAATLGGHQSSPADPADLLTRVGFSNEEAATARSGQPVVRVLPAEDPSQVAAAGAIRIRGDIERLAVWIRDIEAFRRALGAETIGRIDVPATVENFNGVAAEALDLSELERCAKGRCDLRMPAAYAARLKEVPWGSSAASGQATATVRQLLADHARTYQQGGDHALGALYDPRSPEKLAEPFRNLIRRAVPVWRLAADLAAYLEEYPNRKLAGVDERFYWTREAAVRTPVATLHHVVLVRLPDRSLRLADKQFYASRDIDAGVLIGQATPTADGRAFDLAVSMRARVPMAGSMAGRVFRDRVNREIEAAFIAYLTWLQRSFAM